MKLLEDNHDSDWDHVSSTDFIHDVHSRIPHNVEEQSRLFMADDW
jgi:hypothetical protein